MTYTHIVLGGTFDHFHLGHEKLLSFALGLSEQLSIGLTSDAFVHEKLHEATIQSYADRKKGLEDFLTRSGRMDDCTIIEITDVYGTTLTDASLEAIVVTEETKCGAEIVNTARKEKGLPIFPIHVCDFAYDEQGGILSSTRIRAGLVNRKGFVYESLFAQELMLSASQLSFFHEPLGNVISSLDSFQTNEMPLFSVGDIVTHSLVEKGISFTCAYTDGKTHRAPYEMAVVAPYTLSVVEITNEPGHISKSAADHVKSTGLSSSNSIYQIQGEEDLVAIPVMLLCPLGSRVLYGQPFGKEGVVVVEITEELKEKVRGVLQS
jgi:pantetheine-phosphate adenylyltransferase